MGHVSREMETVEVPVEVHQNSQIEQNCRLDSSTDKQSGGRTIHRIDEVPSGTIWQP